MKKCFKVVLVGFALMILGIVMVFSGEVNAKTKGVTKTFGRTGSYNYNQCDSWISGWNSCAYGCGWTVIASAKSKLKGAGYTPKVLFKNVSKSTLNRGMSPSELTSWAKRVGLSASGIGTGAKTVASAIYNNSVVALNGNGHWVLAYGAKVNFTYNTSTKKYKYHSLNCLYIEDPGHKENRGKCLKYSGGARAAIRLK